ncbi:MAG: glycosyltransferase, partial [Brevundimonas sp.]
MPTYNERENVPLVVAALRRALTGIAFEVVFVDDNSPDGTATIAREIAATDPRVRVICRIGRRGLAGACIEGMLSS